jgi:hypothetical protein
MSYPYLDMYAKMATWSLEEAALLVNNLNPMLEELTFDPASYAYYWLRKEHEKDLNSVTTGQDGEPRFSPGTIVRRLLKKGKYVSPMLRKALDRVARDSTYCKARYLKAAALILQDHPNLPLTVVAEYLEDLPRHVEGVPLPRRSAVTIRKYLRNSGHHHVAGRPPKAVSTAVLVDLAKVAKKI